MALRSLFGSFVPPSKCIKCIWKQQRISKEDFFMNIGILILMIIGGGAGVLSSLYIALSFPAVIVWKIYRKIRYGYKLTY